MNEIENKMEKKWYDIDQINKVDNKNNKSLNEDLDKRDQRGCKEKCETCHYFIDGFKKGKCRYFPPGPDGNHSVVDSNHWCGHYITQMIVG